MITFEGAMKRVAIDFIKAILKIKSIETQSRLNEEMEFESMKIW